MVHLIKWSNKGEVRIHLKTGLCILNKSCQFSRNKNFSVVLFYLDQETLKGLFMEFPICNNLPSWHNINWFSILLLLSNL